MNEDGSNVRRISPEGVSDVSPTWAPDASRIAFLSYRVGESAIFTMAPDGSNVQRLTHGYVWSGQPSWSPCIAK
jgi:TolB protein